MTEPCPSIEELGPMAELAAGDPRRAHVDSCPRCRGLLAAFAGFVAGSPSHADPAREARLAAGLAALATPASRREPGTVVRILRSRVTASLLATAAVLVLVVGLSREGDPLPGGPAGVTRTTLSAKDFGMEARVVTDGGYRLSWTRPAAPGETFRVVFFGGDLVEVGRIEAGTAAGVDWTPPQRAGGDAAAMTWRIEVVREGDVVARSTPQPLPRR
ncbi:hypothetical protein KDM41_03885 [bacterium]|nr:hypothetical protein [bacterium]